MQFEAASKGNVTMQIWLGKQYLGQTDHAINEFRRVPLTLNELAEEARRFLDAQDPDLVEQVRFFHEKQAARRAVRGDFAG
jgi:hypothetical protein